MLTKTFFKLFPPPKYLNIPYAGLAISDDAIHCIEYTNHHHGYILNSFGYRKLKEGIVDSGYIKDEKALIAEVSSLVKELGITTVKASLPEERMYLFKTEVPDVSDKEIRQNIEFRLEENVPLPASEALFFFDKFPRSLTKDNACVSVSVASRELVNNYLNVLQKAGLTTISFEIQAKAIARAVVPSNSSDTELIVHVMNKKTGLYVVSNGVLCFTSTIPWGGELVRGKDITTVSDDIFRLRHEIEKVYTYWAEKGEGGSIKTINISGKDAVVISQISHLSPNSDVQIKTANIWLNAFSTNHYVPKIPFEDSLDYAVAAGLALP